MKFTLPLLLILARQVHGLSLSVDLVESARLSRGRLHDALTSVAGKLTFSPEIIIPEPKDPTAVLLQSSEILRLSTKIRTHAKANAAFLSGSLESLQKFSSEQEESRGSFPGPVPVIYCPDSRNECTFAEIAEAGASGVLISVCGGETISNDNVEDVGKDEAFRDAFRAVQECGIQGIPEVLLSSDVTYGEEQVTAIVEAIREACGSDPVSVVLSMTVVGEEEEEEEKDGEGAAEEGEETPAPTFNLPAVPGALAKQIAILGGVRVLAGDNRMGAYTQNLKSAGFTGAFLRADCVPGFRINPDLDIVTKFWSAAIGGLKSVRSKNFAIRVKNNMETSVASQWYDYQKDVMSSGALGAESAAQADMDEENGDFVGF